jgi:hypothetical protein
MSDAAVQAPEVATAPPQAAPQDASSQGLKDALTDPLQRSALGGGPGGAASPTPPSAPRPEDSLSAAATLTTPEFGKFAVAMAAIGVDATGAQVAWTTVVEQLLQAGAAVDAVSSEKNGRKVVNLASDGFKKLMGEYQLPKQLDDAFESLVAKDMAGKTVALWSGPAAKTAAAKSGKADIFLEGTPLGKPFDESGLPKGLPAGTLYWALVSRAYAQKLADHAAEVEFAGFVDSNTVESGNIAAEVELPIVGKAVEEAGKTVTWHAAAAEKDPKVWAEGKHIQTRSGQQLTSEPGFWTSGEDRGAVIKTAKASHKAYTDDQAGLAVQMDAGSATAGADVAATAAKGTSGPSSKLPHLSAI